MKLVFLFSIIVSLSVADLAKGTCNTTTKNVTDPYTPAVYDPSWGVTAAAARTSAEITDINLSAMLFDFGTFVAEPYVMNMITVIAALSGFFGIFLFAFLFFLCCRNCKCCCDCLRWKCCRESCGPLKTKKIAQITMFVLFVLLAIISLTGFAGSTDLGNAIESFEEGGTALKANIQELAEAADDLVVNFDAIISAVGNLSGACDFEGGTPIEQSIASSTNAESAAIQEDLDGLLQDARESIVSARDSVADANKTLAGIIDEFKDNTKNFWESILRPIFIGLSLMFVLVALLGIAGTLKWTKQLYCFTIFVGWSFAGLTIILLTVFSVVGIILGDICTPSPLTTFTKVMPNNMTDFFIGCEGVHPFIDVLQMAVVGADGALNSTCTLMDQVGPNTVSNGGVTITRSEPSKCETALNGIDSSVIGMSDVVGDFFAVSSNCKILNEPMGIFLEQGVCNGLASGIYKIAATQICCVWFGLITIYFMAILYGPIRAQDEKKVVPTH